MNLSFEGITYDVKLDKRQAPEKVNVTKTILSGIDGMCEAGSLLAIMGPSGAGKTSLLDILAGRKAQSGGTIAMTGYGVCTPRDVRSVASYVQQDDAIMATQSAREAVTMAALLTLPTTMSKEDKAERISGVMKTFQLEGCADTLVGDPVGRMKGLSGGERKRCAVAMSAIRRPQILFLDEPTSGLDAHKAYILVQSLREMAKNCRSSIICTIHQPSSDIFALFDGLLLLLDGKSVYGGPAMEAVNHFSAAGYPCPQYANPADFFFMHVLTAGGSTLDTDRTTELVNAWEASDKRNALVARVKKDHAEPVTVQAKGSQLSFGSGSKVEASRLTQFTVLFKRCLNDLKRNPLRGKAPIAQSVVMATILSFIWLQVGDDQKSIQDRMGVLFFITTNSMMQNVMGVLTTFGNERGAVLREQENNLYTTLPYFLARLLVDIPTKILGPSVFATITYWMVGFQPSADKFIIYGIVLILMALTGNAMGLFIACIFPDVAIALQVAPIIILPLVMFSGFVLNTDSIPVYLMWLEWISPAKYGFAALARNEFKGLDLRCRDSELLAVVGNDGTEVKVCPFATGNDYYDTLNIQSFLDIPTCCIMLTLMTAVFTFFAFISLSIISWRAMSRARSS